METLSNIASGASKLIYGDKTEQSGTEPVSGQSGAGTATEPYDSGNLQENPEMSGQSAQETREYHPVSHDKEPHSTHLGNALDPKTSSGGPAHDHTFGTNTGSDTTKTSEPLSGSFGTVSEDKSGPAHEHTFGSGNTSGTITGSTPGTGDSSNSGSLGSASGGATGGLVDRSRGPVGGTFSSDEDSSPGNLGTTTSSGPETSVESRESDTLGGSTSAGTTGGGAQGVNTAGAVRPEHQTEGTGVTGIHSNDPHGSDVRPTERDEDRPNVNAGGFGTAEPSVGTDPKSAQQPTPKQQGADRPGEVPTGQATEALKEKKDAGEEALAKRDPDDHSGEPLKVHDGSEKQERSESIPGQAGGGDHGKEKGTGEQYVKSSGLSADGGNFDAAKPGAGREADRLLEEKGVQRTGATADEPSPAPASDDTADKSDKPSLGHKIKEKLHIGKH